MKTRNKQKRKKSSQTPLDTQSTAVIKKTGKKKTKKKCTKDDTKKPKKPPTAFFYFLEDYRKIFQEQNPSIKTMREIGKACGEKWRSLPFDDKVAYYDIATAKRAEYEKSMAEYVKRKDCGELGESDEFSSEED